MSLIWMSIMTSCVPFPILSIHLLGTIKKFFGFYNVECYKILAAWNQGVRDENKKRKIASVEQEEGVEETKGKDGVHS